MKPASGKPSVRPRSRSTGTPVEARPAETRPDPAWQVHYYFYHHRKMFSPEEAQAIIELSGVREQHESKFQSHSGRKVRDASLFWIQRSVDTDWIFKRVAGVMRRWNRHFRFAISRGEPSFAQLTLYRTGQEYSWHMDLGAGPTSFRKVSVVIGLNDPEHYTGGGTEIFYGEHDSPVVRMPAGDAISFPSYVMHRAIPVQSGERWTLVLWLSGKRPFR